MVGERSGCPHGMSAATRVPPRLWLGSRQAVRGWEGGTHWFTGQLRWGGVRSVGCTPETGLSLEWELLGTPPGAVSRGHITCVNTPTGQGLARNRDQHNRGM